MDSEKLAPPTTIGAPEPPLAEAERQQIHDGLENANQPAVLALPPA